MGGAFDMAEDESKSLDIAGIRPLSEAAATGVKFVTDMLGKICLPAAEEFGLLLKERVSLWRVSNLTSVAKKALQKMRENAVPVGAHAHPRLVYAMAEKGSLSDDSTIQDMWAGLLSSSCTESGDDDSNLIFVNVLNELTKLQARVLRHAVEQAQKNLSTAGLVYSSPVHCTFEDLCREVGEKDRLRFDRELDYLRALSLLQGGLDPHDPNFVVLTPTPLALHMYVRCSGSRLSPVDFYPIGPRPATQPPAVTATPS